jgi:Domain of unknown function (DUF4410)
MSVQLRRSLVSCVFVLCMVAGCATTKISDRQQMAYGSIPRPNQVWVYPFAATPADVPPNSALAGNSQYYAPQTPQQIAEGRSLGAEIAGQLVQEINGMGMPAAIASAATRPQVNDIVIEGTVLSVQQGNAAERVVVGFTAGESELQVAVEGFQMTQSGLRELGSGNLDSTGNKTPGIGVGLAASLISHNPAGFLISGGMKAYGEASGSNTIQGRAEAIAKKTGAVLKQRFQQQGWI